VLKLTPLVLFVVFNYMIIHFPQVLYPWLFLEKFIKNRSFQKLRLKIIIICSPLIQSTLLIYYNEFIRLYFNINEKINQNGYFLFNLYFFVSFWFLLCFLLQPLWYLITSLQHPLYSSSPPLLHSFLCYYSHLSFPPTTATTQKPKNPKKTVTALSIHP